MIDLAYSSVHEIWVAMLYLGWFLFPLALIGIASNGANEERVGCNGSRSRRVWQ